ncbi:MAG: hypothetical protein IT369_02740 [Candidatus Latescibacteria bacterium]|nr:hypothetical protein [Candidatus Latescibacterota bacterium]
MHSRSLLGALILTAAVLGCNSTVGEGTKAASSPQPLPGGSGTEVQLNGPHVKTLQLSRGEEGLSLQVQAGGMSGVRQFEFTVALEPAGAFDLNSASFSTASPFITVGSGVEITPEKNLRAIGIYLDAAGFAGDGVLGTLTVKASATPATTPRARIMRFSAGPSSKERDTYTEQQLNLSLNLGP